MLKMPGNFYKVMFLIGRCKEIFSVIFLSTGYITCGGDNGTCISTYHATAAYNSCVLLCFNQHYDFILVQNITYNYLNSVLKSK